MKLIKLFNRKQFLDIVYAYKRAGNGSFSKRELFIIAVSFVNLGRTTEANVLFEQLFHEDRYNTNLGKAYAKSLKLEKRYLHAYDVYVVLEREPGANFFEEKLELCELSGDLSKVEELIIANLKKSTELCVEKIYINKLKKCALPALKILRQQKHKRKSVLISKILFVAKRYQSAHQILKAYCLEQSKDDDAMSLFVRVCAEQGYKYLKQEFADICSKLNRKFDDFGPRTLNDFAVVASKHENLERVTNLFELAVNKDKAPVIVTINLSDIYQKRKEYKKSELLLHRLLRDHKNDPNVIVKLADYYAKIGSTFTAMEYQSKLLKVTNGQDGTLGLVKSYQDLAQQETAEKLLLSQQKDDPEALRYYLYNSHYVSDINSETLLERYNKVGMSIAEKYSYRKISWVSRYNKCLKVGLFSSDFYEHPTANFLSGFIKLADYDDVELYLISNTKNKDGVTEHLSKKFDQRWVDVSALSTEASVNLLRSLNLDIAVDLNGHTGNHRMDIFAQRIANKQIATLGLMCTTGLPFFDFLMLPENFKKDVPDGSIVEKFIPLKSPVPFRTGITLNTLPANFSTEKLVMICCSRLVRHSERLWHVWGRIQQRTGATLVINCRDMRSKKVREVTLERLLSCGLEEKLVELKFTSPIFKAYDEADITLDTFPANSGTTLCESVVCGKPFVTMNSVCFIGAIGEAILHRIDERSLVTTTEEDYIDRAVSLLADTAYRENFFDRREQFKLKLSETDEFVRDLRNKFLNIAEQ